MNTNRRTFLKGVGASTVVLAGVPSIASAKSQAPNVVFDLDFDETSDAGMVGADTPGWTVDRQAPSSWDIVEFDGDDRLEVGIGADGPTDGFYGYHGMKYLPEEDGHWNTGYGTVLSYSFYIDPDWETDETGQQTGMWAVIGDDSGSIVAYPILEYQDSDASETDEAQFRVYSYDDGWGWTDLGTPRSVDPEEGGWVDVEMRLLRHGKLGKGKGKKMKGGKLHWHVNGSLVYEDNGLPYYGANNDDYGAPSRFFAPILNSANFGSEQLYYYDDITLDAPGTNGKGR